MAFLFIRKGNKDVLRQINALDSPLTFLSAKEGMVIALPDETLPDLPDGDRYQLITEESLKERLTERGLQYYQSLCSLAPESLFRETKLPPLHHVTVDFHISKNQEGQAKQLLLNAGAEEIHTKPGIRLFAFTDPLEKVGTVEAKDEEAGLLVSCVIPKSQVKDLIASLVEKHIAGYSRSTQVLVGRDPDGPRFS